MAKKPVLLLQFRTDQSLKHEVDCVIKNSGIGRENLDVINIVDPKSEIPTARDVAKYSSIIAGGSGSLM